MCARILCSKLLFQHRVYHGENKAFNSIAASDVTSSYKPKFSKSKLDTEFIPVKFSVNQIFNWADRISCLKMTENHSSLRLALNIAKEMDGWSSECCTWTWSQRHQVIPIYLHPYLPSNYSAWDRNCHTLSLKQPHCTNNATQTYLLRSPLMTSQTVSSLLWILNSF